MSFTSKNATSPVAIPPVADKRPHELEAHGIKRTDDYHWLRADNWQEAMREPEKLPEDIKAYLNAENTYYDEMMQDTLPLQETLIAEMRGRIKEDESSIPVQDSEYLYQSKYEEGQEYSKMLRTDLDGKNEQILIDYNVEAEGQDYFVASGAATSPDHNKMLWAADTSGAEYYALRVRDLTSGKDLDYVIKDVGSFDWIDNEHIIYTRVDEHHRPSKVFRHKIGDDPKNEELVLEEQDPRFFMGLGRMLSGKFVDISIAMNDQSEHWVLDTSTPNGAPRCIEPRADGIEYEIDHQINDMHDRFIITTNAENATDFKIVTAPVDKPQRENWAELVPHVEGRMILSAQCYKHWVLHLERKNALPSIVIHDQEGNQTPISFEEEAYAIGLQLLPEYENNVIRFQYSSPTTPDQTFEYDLTSAARKLLKEKEVPSGHNAKDYVARRIIAKSHDGAEVPVTVLHHKDTKLDGSAPCFLYGYGSYGISIPAGFSTSRLSLIDRGFIFAIAHIRGGEEKGRAWYKAAKFGGKSNTFHDFIAAGEMLASENFTSRGQIVCNGGSAGGLLVGAVVNMAPDLFAGAIADVPFVDVLNTILDDTLPLTPGEWSQWGNPIESKEAYNWIAGYSPYDNVEAKAYPHMLITAGVSDPRVTYWEPAKWVAKLREFKVDDNILMLRTNMTSGHFGKSGRFAALEDSARTYAFALKSVGRA
jgi:oligopeptidase B